MLELIRQFLHRKPFRPFRVVMRSGARYDVFHSDRVALARSKAIAFLPRPHGMTVMPEGEIELVYERRRARK